MAFIADFHVHGLRLLGVRRLQPVEHHDPLYEAYFVHAHDGMYTMPFGARGDPDFVSSKSGRDRDVWRNVICNGVPPNAAEMGLDNPYVLMWYLANGPSNDMQQNIDMYRREFQL